MDTIRKIITVSSIKSLQKMLPVSLIMLVFALILHCPISEAQAPAIDWTHAGYPGEIPYVNTNVIDVTTVGVVGDGVTDNSAAIQAAIDSAPNPAVLYFPAGIYRINSTLRLSGADDSGIVLRGAGHQSTRIECLTSNNTSGNEGCISIKGGTAGGYVNITSGSTKGSTQIVVADASSFTVGEGGHVLADDIVTPEASWGADAVAQMVNIVAINGNTLTIHPPLHLDYTWNPIDSSFLNPRIRPIRYIEQVGIEDLELRKLDSGTSGKPNFNFNIEYAADSWIRRVDSNWSESYHIAVAASLHLEIRDSYIHGVKVKGDGGQGYGVSLARSVTSVLVENNIFYDLRHSMIIQMGVNGCVFGYNYSEKNYSDDDWIKTHVSLHGHYPFMNLFEGNIASLFGVGDWWGPIGPGNTFFRNKTPEAERYLYGTGRPTGQIDVCYIHGPQYIIGNEIPVDGTHGGIEFRIGDPHPDVDYPTEHAKVLVHGNNIAGTVTWASGYPQTIPNSYYLSSKPAFYGSMAFPSLGGDLPIGQGTNPALVRWQAGTPIPQAEQLHILWTR